jgi:hypothetical protein
VLSSLLEGEEVMQGRVLVPELDSAWWPAVVELFAVHVVGRILLWAWGPRPPWVG